MRLFRFDAPVGKDLTQHHSANVAISPILRTAGSVQVACMHVQAKGVIGAHPAVKPQLFLVVEGEGWVRGEADQRIPLAAGQAAFWQAGEHHESGSNNGMTALVIEGDDLDPDQYLTEIS